ncbi:MAG: winged helix-turn-helix transcriptional regulator, partial [Desulfurococcales archaeon]|nr:winged helix-turn-helix transcriptional regulator [Desulfurococcales archaeon]
AKRRGQGLERLLPLLILLLVAGALMGSIAHGQQAVVEAQVIRIQGDGVVAVGMEALLYRGLNEIPVPAPAIPATIIVSINGSVVPPLYVNNTIIVVSESDGARAHISYVAESSVADGIVSLNVTPVGEATLIVNPNIVLLSLPAGITGVQVEDNGTIIFTFTKPSTIKFTLSQAVVPPQANETEPGMPVENATQDQQPPEGESNETRPVEQPTGEGVQEAPAGAPQTQQEANETQQEAQPGALQDAGQGGQEGPPIGYIIAGLVALAVLVLTALYLARRKSQRRNPWAQMFHEEGPESEMVQPGLNEVDYQIIEALKNFGGELYQSDLQRLLGIPKTTLWRHIRKLADMGIVEIVKEGRANKIKLLKEQL